MPETRLQAQAHRGEAERDLETLTQALQELTGLVDPSSRRRRRLAPIWDRIQASYRRQHRQRQLVDSDSVEHLFPVWISRRLDHELFDGHLLAFLRAEYFSDTDSNNDGNHGSNDRHESRSNLPSLKKLAALIKSPDPSVLGLFFGRWFLSSRSAIRNCIRLVSHIQSQSQAQPNDHDHDHDQDHDHDNLDDTAVDIFTLYRRVVSNRERRIRAISRLNPKIKDSYIDTFTGTETANPATAYWFKNADFRCPDAQPEDHEEEEDEQAVEDAGAREEGEQAEAEEHGEEDTQGESDQDEDVHDSEVEEERRATTQGSSRDTSLIGRQPVHSSDDDDDDDDVHDNSAEAHDVSSPVDATAQIQPPDSIDRRSNSNNPPSSPLPILSSSPSPALFSFPYPSAELDGGEGSFNLQIQDDHSSPDNHQDLEEQMSDDKPSPLDGEKQQDPERQRQQPDRGPELQDDKLASVFPALASSSNNTNTLPRRSRLTRTSMAFTLDDYRRVTQNQQINDSVVDTFIEACVEPGTPRAHNVAFWPTTKLKYAKMPSDHSLEVKSPREVTWTRTRTRERTSTRGTAQVDKMPELAQVVPDTTVVPPDYVATVQHRDGHWVLYVASLDRAQRQVRVLACDSLAHEAAWHARPFETLV
ncbi:hypothetical protein GGR56DRAFT_157433 [Xylariaceae sp. FL0804]|nr:hypothetical protein GGR56DRAFT_157433 [Xylariaceae sp. FL0804]